MRLLLASLSFLAGCGGSAARSEPEPSGVETAGTEASSGRREDPVSQSVSAAVRAAGGDVMACYDAALDAGRTEGGQLTVRIVIGADGNVVGVTATQDAVGGGVAECALEVLSHLHVETPPAEPTPFEYPFRFRPAS